MKAGTTWKAVREKKKSFLKLKASTFNLNEANNLDSQISEPLNKLQPTAVLVKLYILSCNSSPNDRTSP